MHSNNTLAKVSIILILAPIIHNLFSNFSSILRSNNIRLHNCNFSVLLKYSQTGIVVLSPKILELQDKTFVDWHG